ncbi:MAG TPA: acetate--CoA ligase family protein [Thermoanaerobaculia bacterium]|nr:acetate--CoA ligase family protein [Thermoanaerobaculia bacterium]
MNSRLSACIDAARRAGRDVLLEHEAGEILAALGIQTPQQVACSPAESDKAAAFVCERFPGARVVVKAASTTVLHKTELGGVRFVEKNRETITTAIAAMERTLGCGQYTISELIEHDLAPGAELLLGIRWTADFGPVVSLGAGGVATEFLTKNMKDGREIAIMSPGLTANIGDVLSRAAIVPLVTGGVRRQKPRATADSLRELVERCLAFAESAVPDLVSEIEVNPVVPTPNGFYALDAVVRIGKPVRTIAERPIEKIERLLQPRSVAVVGVSRSLNAGHVIVNNLIREGVSRDAIFIVKPGENELEGCRCVDSIDALPQAVDLLVLAISAEQVPAVIESAIAGRKAESIVVIPGGLGEHEGSENLEQRVRDAVAASRETAWRGPVVNGANCVGVLARGSVNTIFLPDRKIEQRGKVAPVAIVSQSGALAVVLATKLGSIAPRFVVSIGNQIDLTVGDYMQYFASRDDAGVLAFYVEGFREGDGRHWLEAAKRAIASGRQVILYRAGRTPAGAKASQSHTAAVAGEYVVTRELASAAGVMVAESLDEFADLVRVATLLRGRTFTGTRLGAMSNAGFETVAIADHTSGLQIATFDGNTRERIVSVIAASRLDSIVTIANPLDVNPMLGDEAFVDVATAVVSDPNVDLATFGIVPLTGALATLEDEIGRAGSIVDRLTALWCSSRKPWICVVDGGAAYDAMAARLEENGIPALRTADRAIRVLAKWSAAAQLRVRAANQAVERLTHPA